MDEKDNRYGFLIDESFDEIFSILSNEQVGELMKSLSGYFFHNEEYTSDDVTVKALIYSLKNTLDTIKKKRDLSIMRSKIGKKGGRPKTKPNQKQTENQNETKPKTKTENSQKNGESDNIYNIYNIDIVDNIDVPNKEYIPNKEINSNTENKLNTEVNKENIYCQPCEKNEQTANKSDRIDYEAYKKVFNEHTTTLPKCLSMNDKRKQKLMARIDEFKRLCPDVDPLATFTSIVDKVQESDFASGRTGQWTCSLDWLIENSGNWVKVIEGNYANNKSNNTPKDSIGVVLQPTERHYTNSWEEWDEIQRKKRGKVEDSGWIPLDEA